MKLERIKKIDLRKTWKHEASDFTNWLAEKENLALLSQEIDIELSLIETEASVGRFNVDIVAEDISSNKKVIIENQLEVTDHSHLGQIITYASGIGANTVIWVVKEAREEHRQAIDWLNENTTEDLDFFLIKIEVWQIGDSPYAPKFDIISKPNDWSKNIKRSVSGNKITETKAKQQDFWDAFKEYAEKKGTKLSMRKTSPQHWYNLSIGVRDAHLALTLNSFDNVIRTELYIPNNKDLYYKLQKNKDKIEFDLDKKLIWLELEGKLASRIRIEKDGNIDEEERWEEFFTWMLEYSERFKNTFIKYIKK